MKGAYAMNNVEPPPLLPAAWVPKLKLLFEQPIAFSHFFCMLHGESDLEKGKIF